MPGVTTPRVKSGRRAWEAALNNAKKRRMWPNEIPLKELSRKHRATPDEVADVAIRLHVDNGFVDPLVPRYIEYLTKGRYTGSGNVLLALLRHSRFSRTSTTSQHIDIYGGLPSLEEQVFILLREIASTTELSFTGRKAHVLVLALTRWLYVARKANAQDVGKQLDSGVMHAGEGPESGTFEALGLLAVSVFGHRSFKDIEKEPWWKTRRAQIVDQMEQYDSHVLQWIQSQFTGHLQALAKTRPFLETDEKGMPKFEEQQILDSIPNLPIVQSRAGLLVWLSACLCGRPLTDEATMRNYLLVRFGDNAQTAAVEFLVACFDVLTNAAIRQDPPHVVRSIRSFICNKVPILLQSLLGFSEADATERCVQVAFMSITIDPLAPLSAGATDVRDVLQRTRRDFLFACALHTLISETAIVGILNEPTVTLPKVTKYTKQGLVAQSTANSGRLENLIAELESMQGNAGAISHCVIDMVLNLCANKDTMTLKVVCQALMKKPSNLDALMQFAQPTALLLPLCNVLNEWVHDQDQSEFQPPYEEFACMLLLVLTTVHRYNLNKTDLGLTQDDNFVTGLLGGISQSMQPSELTDEQRKQLAKWIEGLYATDEHGETTGIGDEVMSHCPPQAFYLLVPTLFEQSVLACKSNALSINTAKGGLEFLLEPFLLPSLIGGITWLVRHSWTDHDDADILLQILDKLLKPSSTSQEMQIMHKCILGIVAVPLEKSLQELIRRKPEKKKIASGLIDVLRPYLNQQRCATSKYKELESFTSAGSLPTHLRNTIRDLTAWASNPTSGPPPRYPSTLLPTAMLTTPAAAILNALASEIHTQTSTFTTTGSIAVDICAALITSPNPATYMPLMDQNNLTRHQLTLREHLHLQITPPTRLLALPAGEAEALVRLQRVVEAQSAVSQLALVDLAPPDPISAATVQQQNASDQIMQDLDLGNLAQAADASGTGDFNPADFGTGAGSLDLGNSSNAQQDLDGLMQGAGLMDMGGVGGNDAVFRNLGLGSGGQQMGDDGDGGQTQGQAEDDIFGDLNFDFS